MIWPKQLLMYHTVFSQWISRVLLLHTVSSVTLIGPSLPFFHFIEGGHISLYYNCWHCISEDERPWGKPVKRFYMCQCYWFYNLFYTFSLLLLKRSLHLKVTWSSDFHNNSGEYVLVVGDSFVHSCEWDKSTMNQILRIYIFWDSDQVLKARLMVVKLLTTIASKMTQSNLANLAR